MEDQQQREIHFLHAAAQPAAAVITTASFHAPSSRPGVDSPAPKSRPSTDAYDGPSLDLQLSISLRPLRPPPERPAAVKIDAGYVEALRWQAAEQMRVAAMEKAYAERVRELTRREMELAQSEFARARSVWERAREEVKKAEQLKERATLRIDATCMEITCHSCCQKFRPTA